MDSARSSRDDQSSGSTSAAEVLTAPKTSPEPGLTPQDMIERARALVPMLIEQQAETEERTFYSQEIHEAFTAAGLYLITHPKRYGGYGFGLDTFFKVVVELTRGCASTGWCYGLGSGHTVALSAFWPEEVQEEIMGGGEPFICPATTKPQGIARKVDGGWRITGTFNYCSGSPYASYFWGHAIPEGAPLDGLPMQFIIPKSEWVRLDDWGTTHGLRGSGSHSIKIDDGFVPDRLVIENSSYMMFDPTGGTIGAELHDNPMYNGRMAGWLTTEFTAIAVGMAKAALDVFAEKMETGKTPFPPIISRVDDYDYQLYYGDAVSQVFIAEAILDGALRHMQAKSEIGDFTLEDDLLVARLAWNTADICSELITPLMRGVGSSQIRQGTRVERLLRDFNQFYTHTGFLLLGDMAARDLARVRWDVNVPADIRTIKPPS